LAGLIEADGHFSQKTCRISYDLFHRIVMENIIYGVIKMKFNIVYSQKQAMDYGISFNDSKVANQGELIFRKEALKDLLKMTNGHYLGPEKINQVKHEGFDSLYHIDFKEASFGQYQKIVTGSLVSLMVMVPF